LSVLVVGAGYLGQRVALRLIAGGRRVFGTARSPERARELSALGIEPVLADVCDERSLEALTVADLELVVFCVGSDRRAGLPMRAIHVDGLTCVIDRLAGRARRILYTSSSGVYGAHRGAWVDEATLPEPGSDSGRVILEAEERLFKRAGAAGLEAVVVRLAGLYGPGRVVRRALVERGAPIPGDPEHILNLIHIEDATTAVLAALERGASGQVYLAADDRPVTRREYYGLLAELLGVGPPRFELPAAGSADALRDEGQKRICNRRMKAELGVVLRYPDITTGLPTALAGVSTLQTREARL
jgi:nucleoside-diphosphate-sugar epimerase